MNTEEDIERIEILDIHRRQRTTRQSDVLTALLLTCEQARDDRMAEIMAMRGECTAGCDWVTWNSRQN